MLITVLMWMDFGDGVVGYGGCFNLVNCFEISFVVRNCAVGLVGTLVGSLLGVDRGGIDVDSGVRRGC